MRKGNRVRGLQDTSGGGGGGGVKEEEEVMRDKENNILHFKMCFKVQSLAYWALVARPDVYVPKTGL